MHAAEPDKSQKAMAAWHTSTNDTTHTKNATRKRSTKRQVLVMCNRHHLLDPASKSALALVCFTSCLPKVQHISKNANREDSAPGGWWRGLSAEGSEGPPGGLEDSLLRRAFASERCFWSLSICSSFCCAWKTLNPICAKCTYANSHAGVRTRSNTRSQPQD